MIGQRINKLRLEKKISISELAERSGVAKSYISKLEKGIKTNPSIQLLEKVADALEVTIDDILHDKAPAQEEEEIDKQWLSLIRKAMVSGVSKEQFQEFLEFNKWKIENKD
jgi:XRE family transcriptional regulator, master regulator for biofilm formation